jgi:hypothetical protein
MGLGFGEADTGAGHGEAIGEGIVQRVFCGLQFRLLIPREMGVLEGNSAMISRPFFSIARVKFQIARVEFSIARAEFQIARAEFQIARVKFSIARV